MDNSYDEFLFKVFSVCSYELQHLGMDTPVDLGYAFNGCKGLNKTFDTIGKDICPLPSTLVQI